MTTLNRRTVLASTAALGLTGAITGALSAQSEHQKSEAKTYVLVHGAWHGGWCWRDVAKGLRAAGHTVYTPTLTGLGERVHLASRDVDVSMHATDIINTITFNELSDVVLVGHSYAGYVVTMVADAIKDRLRHVVYLDAVLPSDGSVFIPEEQHETVLERYGADYALPVSGMDFLGVPEDHPLVPWLKRHLVPHPLGTLLETVNYQNEGAAGLPKTFIRCSLTPNAGPNDPALAVTEGDPEWTYTTLDTGHDAMVTAPKELTEMLAGIG